MSLYRNFSVRNSTKIQIALEERTQTRQRPNFPWRCSHTQKVLMYHSAQAVEGTVKSDLIIVHIPEPLCHKEVAFARDASKTLLLST